MTDGSQPRFGPNGSLYLPSTAAMTGASHRASAAGGGADCHYAKPTSASPRLRLPWEFDSVRGLLVQGGRGGERPARPKPSGSGPPQDGRTGADGRPGSVGGGGREGTGGGDYRGGYRGGDYRDPKRVMSWGLWRVCAHPGTYALWTGVLGRVCRMRRRTSDWQHHLSDPVLYLDMGNLLTRTLFAALVSSPPLPPSCSGTCRRRPPSAGWGCPPCRPSAGKRLGR